MTTTIEINEFKKKHLTSELSLEDGALLLLPAVSLVGTTVICCIGMLLFLGNALVAAASLHPQHSEGASRPPITVISCPIRRPLRFFHLSPQAPLLAPPPPYSPLPPAAG